jgi:hypothetical protein
MFRRAVARKWNRLFAGGCPICKSEGTLTPLGIHGAETHFGIMFHLACDNCGSKFSVTSKVGGFYMTEKNVIFRVSEGDPKYLGKTFSASDWARIRKGETPALSSVTVLSRAVRFPEACSNCLKPQADRRFTVRGGFLAGAGITVTHWKLSQWSLHSLEAPICSACQEAFGVGSGRSLRELFFGHPVVSKKRPIAITIVPVPTQFGKSEETTGPFTFSFLNPQYAELFRELNVPGAQLATGERFCINCGSRIPVTAFCPKCGAQQNQTSGTKLR